MLWELKYAMKLYNLRTYYFVGLVAGLLSLNWGGVGLTKYILENIKKIVNSLRPIAFSPEYLWCVCFSPQIAIAVCAKCRRFVNSD